MVIYLIGVLAGFLSLSLYKALRDRELDTEDVLICAFIALASWGTVLLVIVSTIQYYIHKYKNK